MMGPTPEPGSAPPPDVKLTRLLVELNNMRDALVGLSLLMQDYLYELDSTQRVQATYEADQAIERAKALACQPRKLCDD
jgi:hypothetical protein